MASRNSAGWSESMKLEYSMLIPHLVTHQKASKCWTFRVKHDNMKLLNKSESRLIAQGFSQIPGPYFNNTYSPTIRFTSIWHILTLTCWHNLELWHIDIEGAYLNGILEDDVYIGQPEGFIEKGTEQLVCKLNKGIYRLKQSGRVWHCTLKYKLEKTGFTPGNNDSTVYYRFGDIRGSFKIQDLGEWKQLLGIQISRNQELGMIFY